MGQFRATAIWTLLLLNERLLWYICDSICCGGHRFIVVMWGDSRGLYCTLLYGKIRWVFLKYFYNGIVRLNILRVFLTKSDIVVVVEYCPNLLKLTKGQSS